MASMATRECFSSAARNQARVESDPRVARPRGSNIGHGAVAPGMSSRPAAIAEDVRPTWAGAKAAAEPARARRVAATFMLTCEILIDKKQMPSLQMVLIALRSQSSTAASLGIHVLIDPKQREKKESKKRAVTRTTCDPPTSTSIELECTFVWFI